MNCDVLGQSSLPNKNTYPQIKDQTVNDIKVSPIDKFHHSLKHIAYSFVVPHQCLVCLYDNEMTMTMKYIYLNPTLYIYNR